MGAQLKEEFISVAQFWEMEENSDVRHEYLNGRVYAMAGGTPNHAKIIFNISVAIGSRLRGKPCSGSSSDQLVKIERSGLRTYPNVLVSCPPQRFDADEPNALLNPVLLVEVLSPSTQSYDRAEKWEHYRQIPELRDYLLISSERVRVEHLHRNEQNQWILWTAIERDDVLRVPDLELEIPLDEIYENIELPEGLTRI
ncbi:Endonuclease, Uma2 family (restriction endonuclease fold) [Abditibacterium utsteinense]|uniref:Endonuclease, Uma2 family (Restriction endonuclease fold) n=1 Tax=Abditibacterium utsteinense TaxID=1960156 RepID=A0A2S8STF7_9BACT|nr:Uma2 family endonuclease [Abditibacterium utsteinense]PQV64080.1 Endonuclease, Uma2 family (restriction endonuclease fold) [Abditibacterium utsteinense]